MLCRTKSLFSRFVLILVSILFVNCGFSDKSNVGSDSPAEDRGKNVFLPVLPSDPHYLTGVDGATTINVAATVLNNFAVLGTDAPAGATQINPTASTDLDNLTFGTLAAGDLLLIVQMQGATINATNTVTYGNVSALNNAGHYEFVTVASVVNATQINISSALQHSFSTSGHTQIIRVPQLTTLTVTAPGTITAPAWDGFRGGIVALHVQGATTLNNAGSINVSGLGFRGGVLDSSSVFLAPPALTSYRTTAIADGAEKGEGIAGFQTEYDLLNGRYGRGAPANGGGGGNRHNAGGGGGANGNNGNTWTGQGFMDSTVTGGAIAWTLDPGYISNGYAFANSSGGGRGGYTYSSLNVDALTVAPGQSGWGGDLRNELGGLGGRPLSTSASGGRIFMGGGGGAGDSNGNGGAGGRGGGIVYILTNSVAGTGTITANGSNGASTTGFGSDGAGGGGGGGSVFLNAPLSLTGISISANGGNGGLQSIVSTEAEGPGGGGGGGYISTSTTLITRTAGRGANGTTNSAGLTEFPANGATSGALGQATDLFTTFPYGPASNDISVSFSTASQSASEGTATVTVTVTQNNISTLSTSIPFAISGTANGVGTDYSVTASPITIPAGSTSASIVITLANDTLDESDETVIVTMGIPTNATQGATLVHTSTILDDDPVPTLTFTADSQLGTESIGTMIVTAQLSVASSFNVTIPFTISGTASGLADYTVTSSPIIIPAGSTTAPITIAVIDDAIYENSETVILTMGSPTNATLGATSVHTATINDNDASPVVNFTSTNQTVGENVGTITVTAQLGAISGQDVVLPFALSGTATGNGTDYTITASPITILAGSLTGNISLDVINDLLNEPTESIIVTMGSPTGATAGVNDISTVTITDNDAAPTVSFSVASQSAAESVGTFTITAQLSAISGQTVSVPFTLSGTASTPADYSTTASTIGISAGSTTGTITITVVDDSLNEANETVIVTMDSPTNASQGAVNVNTLTINDDDATPTVEFTSASQTGLESVGTMTVTAQLSAVSALPVTVPYVVTGTASNSADYTISSSPMTIPAGSTTASTTITVVDDSLNEASETVVITMATPTNATQGTTTVHAATITDNDAAPTVTFATAFQSVSEGAATMTITAQLSEASGQDITVPYVVTGTATDGGTDYSITGSPITIAAGSTIAIITVTIVNDVINEPSETVIVTMGSPMNATPGATIVHTATITDDDIEPTISFSAATLTVAESVGTTTVTATLSAVSGQTVIAPYVVTGTANNPADYSIAASPITIPAGSLSASATITVVDDTTFEASETVIVTMGSPLNATQGTLSVHTATISDNDTAPTVTFTAASQSGLESGGTMTITANLSAASGQTVTIPYVVTGTASNPADYIITASPITIPEGTLSGTIMVNVVDDTLHENNETVIVMMSAPINATTSDETVHTITITDNDSSPNVDFTIASQTVAENVGAIAVTAQLDAVSGVDVSIPFNVTGTANSGTDYTISSSPILISAGSLTGAITINVINDTLNEATETMIATMASPTGANAGTTTVSTVNITDNDAGPTVSWNVASQSLSESVATFTITAQLSDVSGLDVAVPFILSGTATHSVDYAGSLSPVIIFAGATAASITFTIVADTLDEPDETIIATMGTPTNATAGAISVFTGTILDDDATPTIFFATETQTVSENVGNVTFTVNLSEASAQEITVPFLLSGTANSPADYAVTASPMMIPAGATATSIVLAVVDDSIDENDETVIVTLGAPSNATLGATFVNTTTIADNDTVADTDGDGVADIDEGKGAGLGSTDIDTDGDGTADYLDTDSDNDGIPDLLESGLGAYDTNGDGFISTAEVTASGLDGDADGIFSLSEIGPLSNSDLDAIPNFRDLDSNNDGVIDLEAAALTIYDLNHDHRISPTEAAPMDDGVAPDLSGGSFNDNGVINLGELSDMDGDSISDYSDSDSDSDGVPDMIETGRYVCDANHNGVIDYPSEIAGCSVVDSNHDGYLTSNELAIADHDNDGNPDYIDDDSDSDGIGDLIEAYLVDADSNHDGIISPAEYAAAVSTIGDFNSTLNYNELVDTDGDGTPDMFDTDSDSDKISDLHESDSIHADYNPLTVVYLRSQLYDTDFDGIPDFRDTDSDDDGVLDSVEAGDTSLITVPVDTDVDGIPDFQDIDSDHDGLLDADELTLHTSRTNPDSDGDGVLDSCEVFGNTLGCEYINPINAGWYLGMGSIALPITNPLAADTDGGGTNDLFEAQIGTDPRVGHGADDPYQSQDPDGDGLTNGQEVVLGTNPLIADTEGDGINDGQEVNVYGTNPRVADTDGDSINDGYEILTLHTDPLDRDTDHDGLDDNKEIEFGTNPLIPDTDGDGLTDGQEVNIHHTDPLKVDTDGDSLSDLEEVNTTHTNPNKKDSDGDGLSDGDEVNQYNTDPNKKDTDNGGLNDGTEIARHTDPLNPRDDCPNKIDTDRDGMTDCTEVARGTNPLAPNDIAIQGSGSKGFLGLGGCSSNGATSTLFFMMLFLFGWSILQRRKYE